MLWFVFVVTVSTVFPAMVLVGIVLAGYLVADWLFDLMFRKD